MLKEIEGDILDCPMQYIANQCNCVSNTSSGLAYFLFKKFPYANTYENRDASNRDQMGSISVHGNGQDQRFVINMYCQFYPGPAKYSSDLQEIRLKYFIKCMKNILMIPNIESLALPYKIGCGLAGGNYRNSANKQDTKNLLVLNKTGSGSKTTVYSATLTLNSTTNYMKFGNATREDVYQNDSKVNYQGSDFNITSTVKKYNGLNYITAPSDLWMADESTCQNKSKLGICFGATDYLPFNSTDGAINKYLYSYNSTKPIKYDGTNYYVEDGLPWYEQVATWFGYVTQKRQIIDTSDICQLGCVYNSTGNILDVYFNATTKNGIVEIDPSFYLSFVSQAGDNANFENNTESTQLGIRNIASSLFMDFNSPSETLTVPNVNYNSSYFAGNYYQDNSINNFFGNSSMYTSELAWHNQGSKVNNSLIFDGVGNYVNFGNSSSLNFGNVSSFTFSLWVYSSQAKVNQTAVLFSKVEPTDSDGYYSYMSAGTLWVLLRSSSASNNINLNLSKAGLLDGAWHNLVITYNGSSQASGVKVYIDNQSKTMTVASNTLSTNFAQGIRNLTIGAKSDGTIPSNVSIDEVMVFNRTLTQAEITSLYNNQSAGLRNSGLETDSSLVSYYHLDELSGTNALDSKGTNNGTLINYPTANAPTYSSTGSFDNSGYYSFDGVSDIITSTLSSALTTYTISAQIKNSTATSWSQVVWASDGVNYTNGLVSNPSQKPVNVSSTTVKIGIQGGTYFKGSIDDVKIYNRILSSNEILNLYNGTQNNSNYIGKYSLTGSFRSLVYYNSSLTNWNISLSEADTYSTRTGIVNADNSINKSNSSLVAYWSFDGSINEINGLVNGSCFGSGCPNNATGISSDGLYFNGKNLLNYSSRPQFSFSNSTGGDRPFSACAWNYPNSTSGGLIDKEFIIGTSNSNAEWFLDRSTDTYLIALYGQGVPNGGTYIGRYTATTLRNQWYFVCGTYDGNKSSTGIYVYLNGIRADTTNLNAGTYKGMYNTTSNIHIGARGDADVNMTGIIDEVSLWNKTLSSDEVTQLYKAGLSQHATTNTTVSYRLANNYNISDANLVSFWSMQNNVSTTVIDEKGNHNLTNSGGVYNESYGIVSGGYKLDGSSSYLYSNFNVTGAITVSMWIYPTTASQTKDLFAIGVGNTPHLLIGLSSGVLRTYHNNFYSSTGYTPTINTWTLITYTKNISNYFNVYANGNSVLGTVGANSGDLSITKIGTGYNGYFAGYVDEVRIYNRSLSASEVQDLYNLGNSYLNWTNGGNFSSEIVTQDNVNQTTSTQSNFVQYKINFYSNDTAVSPFVLSQNVAYNLLNPNCWKKVNGVLTIPSSCLYSISKGGLG